MPTYCADSPLPSFSSLKTLFQPLDVWPPFPLVLPDLPTFADASMGSVKSLSMKISHFAQEFMKNCILVVVYTIADAVASIIGGAIDDLLPKIPVLNIGFTEFFTMGPTALYEAITTELQNTGSALWALIPSPIYAGVSSLPLEIVEIVKSLTTNYVKSLVETLTDLVNQAADILEIAGLPAIPVIPTLDDVTTAVRNYMIAEGKSIYDALADLFPMIPSPLFPLPMFGSISSLEIEFRNIMNILMNELIILPLQIIVDFAEDFLGVALSALCIFIPI